MPLDPNIALQVGQPIKPIDPMAAYGQVLTLKHLIDQSRTQGLQEEAMRAKMGRDAEDQQFDTALKRIKVLQGAASGLATPPPDQRPGAWPQVRALIAQSGINDMPENYPGDHAVDAYASLGRDPNKMAEAARETAQQMAFFEAQRQARNAGGGGEPAQPVAGAPGATAPMVGPDSIRMPTQEVTGRRSFSMDPAYYSRLADFVNQDPRLAGTKFANDAVDMGLKIDQDTRKAEGENLHYVPGQDGRMYVFKNGKLLEGPIGTGNDPNANFWTGEDGKPVPNTAAQNYGVTKAKAGGTNLNVDMGKVETSGRVKLNEDFIEKEYRPTMDAASAASRMNFMADAIEKLDIRTGKGADFMAGAAKILTGMGLAPAAVEQYASDATKFQSFVMKNNWEVLNLAKGPQTEGDSQRAMATWMQLENTPEANKYIADFMRAANARVKEKAAYYRKNMSRAKGSGELDNLEREWADSPEANKSIFDYPSMKKWNKADKPTAAVRKYNPATGKIE